MTSRLLTIFEGPDGAGKTTAAKEFAAATGARYVHFPALPLVTTGLARMYVEAMLPALLGYQDVVFDRCWLSEVPYGDAFRDGRDRLGEASRRMLERLALRCGAVVVHCQPAWDTVRANYLSHRHLEMLDNEDQLKAVYKSYLSLPSNTALSTLWFDYTQGRVCDIDQVNRMPPHPLEFASVGNWNAKTILVGEKFADHKDQDPLYQWPFASFSGAGCSQWLTEQLASTGLYESNFLWINADQDLRKFLYGVSAMDKIIALGRVAGSAVRAAGFACATVEHPNHWKRFHSGQQYPLLDLI